jgi:hypothetical protein
LDTKRAHRTPVAGLVSCGLALEVDGEWFPDEAWTDFGVLVLTAWADAATSCLSGSSARFTIHFREGPYQVEVERAQLRCVERGVSRRHVVLACEVDELAVARSVAACATELLSLCRENGWWSDDVAVLEHSLRRLVVELGRRDTPRL